MDPLLLKVLQSLIGQKQPGFPQAGSGSFTPGSREDQIAQNQAIARVSSANGGGGASLRNDFPAWGLGLEPMPPATSPYQQSLRDEIANTPNRTR